MPERPSPSPSFFDEAKRIAWKARKAGLAVMAGIALEAQPPSVEPVEAAPAPTEQIVPATEAEAKPFFDDNPDFFIPFEDGEFSEAERQQRTETLPNGEVIFKDVGLTFYRVQHGDTISEIRQALSQYPEYAHLKTQTSKLQSFNIPEKKLLADMWVPIPTEREKRELTDAQFAHYAELAIDRILKNDLYGPAVSLILEHASRAELLAAMMAIAKQESGGEPIGSLELHRWEPGHKVFSFSYFHVLMEGPGLKARRHLDLTEGQTYHPENAVELFLAFLVEKCKETRKQAEDFFPLPDHYDSFTTFYNGYSTKKKHDAYVEKISGYYDAALKEIESGKLED